MAPADKKADKRRSRADRRAAEEAAAKAAAEKAAKERRQQTTIGIIVVIIVAALLIGAGTVLYRSWAAKHVSTEEVSAAYSQLENVKDKPTRADDQGGILFSKDGYGKKIAKAPTVELYMDPLCPGCGGVNRSLDPTLTKLVEAGQLNLDLHFMSFMDVSSTDDYSTRAAGAAVYIAEHDDDPAHLMAYLQNIYAEDFQPGEASAYEPTGDDKLREQAIKAGVSKDVADKAFDGTYHDWLAAINNYTPKKKELWNAQGGFSTPTIRINGKYWSVSDASVAGLDLPTALLKAIGLDENQVGTSTMPSIGAKGEPQSLT